MKFSGGFMDILSTSLASLITAFSSSVVYDYSEISNTRVTPQIIDHKGQQIYFEHFLWKVRPDSVCSDQKYRIIKYSQCTLLAKEAFQKICAENRSKSFRGHKEKSALRMFCQAAHTYQPTIAMIERSEPQGKQKGELKAARQKCNALTIEVQYSSDPFIEGKRQKACDEYRHLSNPS